MFYSLNQKTFSQTGYQVLELPHQFGDSDECLVYHY